MKDDQQSSQANLVIDSKKDLNPHLNLELDAIIQMRKKKKTANLMNDLLKIRS